MASASTDWSRCRDELHGKIKLLDCELNTAKTEQETAKTCCQELEEKLAAEQSSIKHLQEQHDCEVQQRCRLPMSLGIILVTLALSMMHVALCTIYAPEQCFVMTAAWPNSLPCLT